MPMGLTDRVHIITGSLAKAFAARAGFFTMPAGLRQYVFSANSPSVFSSCLLSYEIAGLEATLEVLRESDAARARLWRNVRDIRGRLSGMGYPIWQGTEQIVSLEAGVEPESVRLRDQLQDRGVIGSLFVAPATSQKRSMVRLSIHSELTPDDIDRIDCAAREILPVVCPQSWPINRRRR